MCKPSVECCSRIENSVSPLSSKKPKECPSNQCSRNCVAAQGTSGMCDIGSAVHPLRLLVVACRRNQPSIFAQYFLLLLERNRALVCMILDAENRLKLAKISADDSLPMHVKSASDNVLTELTYPAGPRTLITTAKKLCFQEQSQWQFQAITVRLKSIRFGQYYNKKGTDLSVSIQSSGVSCSDCCFLFGTFTFESSCESLLPWLESIVYYNLLKSGTFCFNNNCLFNFVSSV